MFALIIKRQNINHPLFAIEVHEQKSNLDRLPLASIWNRTLAPAVPIADIITTLRVIRLTAFVSGKLDAVQGKKQ